MGRKYFPVILDITDLSVLVIGGGNVALQKISMLRQFTGNITVVAPEILPEIKRFRIRMINDIYRIKYLKNAGLVYACTNDRQVNSRISKNAGKIGLPVNVADSPEDCSFISPAIFKKNEMIVAVSSGGRNLKKTIQWRDKIKKIFQDD